MNMVLHKRIADAIGMIPQRGKTMSRLLTILTLLAALLGLAATPNVALAQLAQGTQTFQGPSRIDASTTLCSLAGAVNATQAAGTCTITPPTGQRVYLTGVYVAACADGTVSVSSIQQNFTTTNLGGLVLETAYISAATITTNPGAVQCDRSPLFFTNPIVSVTPGTAVTIVPPAQAAHMSFPITAVGYFAY